MAFIKFSCFAPLQVLGWEEIFTTIVQCMYVGRKSAVYAARQFRILNDVSVASVFSVGISLFNVVILLFWYQTSI